MFDSTTLLTFIIGLLLALACITPYLIRHRAAERKARSKLAKTVGTDQNIAMAMHPQIDAMKCIGCGSCVKVCPEGEVLGLIEGKATLIHGSKCVGHGLCEESCPVGAITLALGSPGRGADLPAINENFETNVERIFIVGELGGIGLIRNAITQGVQAVNHIASSYSPVRQDGKDVIIVGAGPAGLAAAVTAKKHGMDYLLLEQGDIGGTILQYPRRKIVMTAPVEIPLYGKVKLSETTKEALLELWNRIISKTGISIQTNEKVMHVQKGNGDFFVQTNKSEYHARYVILALGRRGTPRKLDVPGEDLSKVAYRLIEAESYQNCHLLVVGGGDSAVEAAVALGIQKGNTVTLSYRKGEFSRIKERNSQRLNEIVREGKVRLMMNSQVQEIRTDEVVLQTTEGPQTIQNDYVFIFAGGVLPNEFLKKIGIQFQSRPV